MTYSEYLNSGHWRELRNHKNKKRCSICGVVGTTDRHHLNYRNLFDVVKSDLRNVCRECHTVAHMLIKNGTIVYINDSNQSRFSRTKNAVKKHRFGSSTIPMKQKLQPW